jgi:hypothetical protein
MSLHGQKPPAHIAHIAQALDEYLNGELTGDDRPTGFALLVWPFGSEPGACTFVTNCDREAIVKVLKEMAVKLEHPDVEGHA